MGLRMVCIFCGDFAVVATVEEFEEFEDHHRHADLWQPVTVHDERDR